MRENKYAARIPRSINIKKIIEANLTILVIGTSRNLVLT